MTDPKHARRRRNLVLPAAVTVAAIALAIAAIGLIGSSRHNAALTARLPVDLQGRPVQAEGVPAPHPLASAEPSGLGRFVVPSVGLDVPLGALSVVDDRIEPPGFTSAYWVRNLGVPTTAPGRGTVFVALHSLRDGGLGPGNYLIDVENQRAKVRRGAAVEVNGVRYRVTRTGTVAKTAIGRQDRVWADRPGRLVVITCLQRRGGGPTVDNLVIEAVRG